MTEKERPVPPAGDLRWRAGGTAMSALTETGLGKLVEVTRPCRCSAGCEQNAEPGADLCRGCQAEGCAPWRE